MSTFPPEYLVVVTGLVSTFKDENLKYDSLRDAYAIQVAIAVEASGKAEAALKAIKNNPTTATLDAYGHLRAAELTAHATARVCLKARDDFYKELKGAKVLNAVATLRQSALYLEQNGVDPTLMLSAFDTYTPANPHGLK